MVFYFFFFKQKTAYEMRISDWSSDVCSSDLEPPQLSSAVSHAPIYEVWPTLSERCVRGEIEFACHPCEPDLLIKLHKVDGKRLYVLIEAKHLSGKSSGPSEDLTAPYDQLAREWDNLVCRCKKDEAEPLLIFLTAD